MPENSSSLQGPGAISSEEVNYLIYRYLLESGFVHSSYTFGNESHVVRGDLKNVTVAPGTLVSILQKGLQYLQVEAHLQEDGTERECASRFSLIYPHVCSDPANPRSEEEERKKRLKREERKRRRKEEEEAQAAAEKVSKQIEMEDVQHTPSLSEDAVWLTGHTNEVYACAWNPIHQDWIAAASGDGTARIWQVSSSHAAFTLNHKEEGSEAFDVSALEWSPDGVLLATCGGDGKARVWKPTLHPGEGGELEPDVLSKHEGAIFAIKWSKNGEMLLTGGMDKTVCVWKRPGPGAIWSLLSQVSNHTDACLDVDWKDDHIFASSSGDKTIQVMKLVGIDVETVETFTGHSAEVNCIRWSPTGNHLASASDDTTARAWKLGHGHVAELRGHEKGVYTLKWCNDVHSTDRILATASFDTTVRLWDIHSSACLHVLRNATEPIYSLSFRNSLLAAGSIDHSVTLWNLDGILLSKFVGSGGVYELSFDKEGKRLAVCFSDGKVAILKVH